MFFGCLPCCGGVCVDLDGIGSRKASDIYAIDGAVRYTATRDGMAPFDSGFVDFNFSAAGGLIVLGEQTATDEYLQSIQFSTEHQLRYSPSYFSALDVGILFSFYPIDKFLPFDTAENRISDFFFGAISGVSFRQFPCLAVDQTNIARYKGFPFEGNAETNILNFNQYTSFMSAGNYSSESLTVHGGEVIVTLGGESELISRPRRTLLQGPRVAGTGAMPWRYNASATSFGSRPLTFSFDLTISSFVFTRGGFEIDLDMLSFGDQPSSIDVTAFP